MEPKISAYLGNLFPRVRGINFTKIEFLGSENIRLMIESIESELPELKKNKQTLEDEIRKISAVKSYEQLDLLSMAEITTELNLRNAQFGNRKQVVSILKTILGNLVKKTPKNVKPVLPTLRSSNYFQTGDDVMVYVCKDRDPEKKLSDCCEWVCATVLKCTKDVGNGVVEMFCNNKVFQPNCSLGGHYHKGFMSSPFIFKRSEWYEIRRILEYQSDHNIEFEELFANNCEKISKDNTVVTWGDNKFALSRAIRSSNVENTTDEQLASSKPLLLENMIELCKHENLFLDEIARICATRI